MYLDYDRWEFIPSFCLHLVGFLVGCQEKVLAGLRERLKNKVREAGLIGLFFRHP